MNQILLDLSLDHKKNNLFQFEMGILMIKLKSTYQKFFYLSELQKKKNNNKYLRKSNGKNSISAALRIFLISQK